MSLSGSDDEERGFRGKEHEASDENMFRITIALVWVASVVAMVLGYLGWSSTNLTNVDKLMRFDLHMGDGAFVLTVRRCMGILFIAGIFLFANAVLGGIAVKLRRKGLQCGYDLVSFVIGFTFLFLGAYALMRQGSVAPVIDSQVADFCNATTYARLTQNLNCDDLPEGIPPIPCGAICQERVDLLASMDGCELLPALCDRFEYEDGPCDQALTIFRSTGNTTNRVSADTCRHICNRDLLCAGYLYAREACYIQTGNVERYAIAPWEEVGVTANDDLWRIKGKPLVLTSFEKHGKRCALGLFFLATVVLLSAFVAWRVLYNHNVSKKSRPSSGELCFFLFCSCCGREQDADDGSQDESGRLVR